MLVVLIVSLPRGIIAVCLDVEEGYRRGSEGKVGSNEREGMEGRKEGRERERGER